MRLRLHALAGIVLLLAAIACGPTDPKEQDELTVRDQFHLPPTAEFVQLRGIPEKGGFFGREGLQITATVQFTEADFDAYVETLHQRDSWKPARYRWFSPARADVYHHTSFLWLPFNSTDDLLADIDHWEALDDLDRISDGLYLCSMITLEGDGAEERAQSGPLQQWRYVSEACVFDGTSRITETIGVLDLERRRLYARISFCC